jgi:ATP-dependent Clp protease ATP-binding subunit ClpA
MTVQPIAILPGSLSTLEAHLKANLIGQDAPMEAISAMLCGSLRGLRYPGQPLCSALLMGLRGCGKTDTVILSSDHLFGYGHLIRFDMSEYQVQGSLERLIGEKSGDRGLFGYHFQATQGYGVILFDEIEKAHPLVLDILLQILSAGRFSLADGTALDLTHYAVFATSNIGARVLQASNTTDADTLHRRAYRAATEGLRPELLDRFELCQTFNRLTYDDLNSIVRLHLVNALNVICAQGHEVMVSQGVLGHILTQCENDECSARPIRAAVMRTFRSVISPEMERNGERRVRGTIQYDRANNRCFFIPSGDSSS